MLKFKGMIFGIAGLACMTAPVVFSEPSIVTHPNCRIYLPTETDMPEDKESAPRLDIIKMLKEKNYEPVKKKRAEILAEAQPLDLEFDVNIRTDKVKIKRRSCEYLAKIKRVTKKAEGAQSQLSYEEVAVGTASNTVFGAKPDCNKIRSAALAKLPKCVKL